MPLVSTAQLLRDAHSSSRGVGAFNVITVEHAQAVAIGAAQVGVPAIIQVSENAVVYHGGDPGPIATGAAAVARAAEVPISLHLDHVQDDELLRRAPAFGFSSVMFDGSGLAYQDNVGATREACRWAHANGLLMEAELGEVGGKNKPHDPGARTDPMEAADFVEQTGVDALAVAVGSSHAMVNRTARLDQDLIAALRCSVPVPLVLHGSSGVPDDELATAVGNGIVKVNVGTALNIAFTSAVRQHLTEHPNEVDPRTYGHAAREDMAATVANIAEVIGQAHR